MWCNKCHFGSVSMKVPAGRKCPMCGTGVIDETRNPFVKKSSGGAKFRSEEIDDDAPRVEKIVKTTIKESPQC